MKLFLAAKLGSHHGAVSLPPHTFASTELSSSCSRDGKRGQLQVEAIAIRMEAIAVRLEAIASGFEAIAII